MIGRLKKEVNQRRGILCWAPREEDGYREKMVIERRWL
jgi:hypothetical protein